MSEVSEAPEGISGVGAFPPTLERALLNAGALSTVDLAFVTLFAPCIGTGTRP